MQFHVVQLPLDDGARQAEAISVVLLFLLSK